MPGIKATGPRGVRFSGTMGGLHTAIILSCVVCVGFGLTSVRDDVNWFKNGERIKNRFVTGVVNGIVDVHCNETAGGSAVEGECLSKVECTKSGGKVGGLCSLLGSCCVIEKTCLQSTSSKLSYFVSPKEFQADCPLTVNVYSKDVCQMRLDFEKFDIAKPTSRPMSPESDAEGFTAFKCHNDSFTVEEVKSNLGFPHLCGRNGGQHIYVPVAEDQRKVVLRFVLKERNGADSGLGQAVWRIKIRQLECRKSGYEHLLNAPSKLMAMYNNLKNKKHPKSDWELIAPPRCLQYYPKPRGTFESFNYDGGRGNYIGNLNYAICLRKTAEVCGAKYTADGIFQLNYNKADGSEEQLESEKCHPRKPAGPEVSQDYIRIPGGVNSQNVNRDNYCNGDLNNGNTIVAKSLEPLYVGVHTDGYWALKNTTEEEREDFEEIGFRIRYELITGQCDTLF